MAVPTQTVPLTNRSLCSDKYTCLRAIVPSLQIKKMETSKDSKRLARGLHYQMVEPGNLLNTSAPDIHATPQYPTLVMPRPQRP